MTENAASQPSVNPSTDVDRKIPDSDSEHSFYVLRGCSSRNSVASEFVSTAAQTEDHIPKTIAELPTVDAPSEKLGAKKISGSESAMNNDHIRLIDEEEFKRMVVKKFEEELDKMVNLKKVFKYFVLLIAVLGVISALRAFAADPAEQLFSDALHIIQKKYSCERALGASIRPYMAEANWASRTDVGIVRYELRGRQRIRISFYIEGSSYEGIALAEAEKDINSKWKFMLVVFWILSVVQAINTFTMAKFFRFLTVHKLGGASFPINVIE